MATALFGITAADLQAKIMPRNGGQSFLIADTGGDLTEAEAEAIATIAEDKVLMRLPARYRRMLRRIECEFVVRYATDGQTSVQTGLFPITNLKLYKNYNLHGKGWAARNVDDQLAESAYSVTLSTGAITITGGLNKGDTLIAEYDHTAAGTIPGLKDIAATIAAVEIARRLAFFQGGDGYDRFSDWESSAYADLNRVISVDKLDNLNVGFETQSDADPYAYIRGI